MIIKHHSLKYKGRIITKCYNNHPHNNSNFQPTHQPDPAACSQLPIRQKCICQLWNKVKISNHRLVPLPSFLCRIWSQSARGTSQGHHLLAVWPRFAQHSQLSSLYFFNCKMTVIRIPPHRIVLLIHLELSTSAWHTVRARWMLVVIMTSSDIWKKQTNSGQLSTMSLNERGRKINTLNLEDDLSFPLDYINIYQI